MFGVICVVAEFFREAVENAADVYDDQNNEHKRRYWRLHTRSLGGVEVSDRIPNKSHMILALRWMHVCLSREEYELLNVCPANTEEEEERHLVSNQVARNNEKEKEEWIGSEGNLDCSESH